MIKVTAAIIEKEGKILIAKRRKGSHLENRWEFPGGKVEPGETPEECLKRELREELGIEARIGNFICSIVHDYGDITIELLAYEALHVSGDYLLLEHEEIRWVFPYELDLFEFPAADMPVIAKLQQQTK